MHVHVYFVVYHLKFANMTPSQAFLAGWPSLLNYEH